MQRLKHDPAQVSDPRAHFMRILCKVKTVRYTDTNKEAGAETGIFYTRPKEERERYERFGLKGNMEVAPKEKKKGAWRITNTLMLSMSFVRTEPFRVVIGLVCAFAYRQGPHVSGPLLLTDRALQTLRLRPYVHALA